MGYKLKKSIKLSQLIEESGLSYLHHDKDVLISNVAAFNQIEEGSLSFSKEVSELNFDCVILLNDRELEYSSNFVISAHPRLDFIKLLNYLSMNIGFSHFDFDSEIHSTVQVGENVVVERGCKIAENVILEHNVVIHSGTTIGKNSRIRTNSSIGGDGFGFERLENGAPIRFPHLGGVKIGENVEIGSINSVARGTLTDTIVEDNVKTDNLVHIAHNCHIGAGVMITACAELSGGVCVGKEAWIGPNASIIQKVSIGENALVGLGAVVTKDIPENTIYAGNPAKYIRKVG